jgi:hypothetical protein
MIDFLNTGRVLIGAYYDLNPLKPKYIEYDEDMLLLQTALIGDVQAIRRSKILNAAYVATLVIVLLGAIIFNTD